MKSKNIRVAILGSTGYGGLQSLRILNDHPNFEVTYLAGDTTVGKYWNDLFPFIPLNENYKINKIDPNINKDIADIVLLSLPNGLASQYVPTFLKNNLRVIDLSADYRFKSLQQWKYVYSTHSITNNRNDEDLCSTAVYGLPELNFGLIKDTNLVACPGCYPTASLLPLLPFLKQGLIEYDGIVIDAKSGSSGGGRIANKNLLLAEISESISPYQVIGHRHTPEIEQIATAVAGKPISVQFTPHLVPMIRGILSNVYAQLRDPGLTSEDCRTIIESFYRNHESILVLPVGTYPSTKYVRNTNKAMLSVQVDKRTGRIVMMCVIDNLIKGQAGQAIQCLNIMNGFETNKGLTFNNFYP